AEINKKNWQGFIGITGRVSSEYQEYTKNKWTDARHFDLCLDSGKIGLDKCVDIIYHYMDSI
ncbi:MAG: cytidylate kinase-like family protein, partial [Salinivirgaceae bacterium]|nr:cytidylate kinase-like family protein [Salinivirgaceae bacterium]